MTNEEKATMNVLIADDSKLVRVLTKRILNRAFGKEFNINLREVESINDLRKVAITENEPDKYDIAILDNALTTKDNNDSEKEKGGTSAYELIKEILSVDPELPIIAMSGRSDHREDVLAKGAKAFFTKPVDHEDFIASIRKHGRQRKRLP